MGRSAIVLAAGHGTRMKSKKHKVLHEVCGKPMILHILDELQPLALDQVIVVTGQQREVVESVIGERAEIAVQHEQKGTGHAVQAALPKLLPDTDSVLVLYGDAPLIRSKTMEALFATREQRQAAAVVLTADVGDPTGLGRVLEGADGVIERVVEEKDATPEESAVSRINTGIYAFARVDLEESLTKVRPANAQAEYYLTDTIAILRAGGRPVYGVVAADAEEVLSVNDRIQLARVERALQMRICEHWMREGVTIIDPARVTIGVDVKIGRDSVIFPGTVLEGATEVGEDCIIGPDARLTNMRVSAGAEVEASVARDSFIGEHTHVGPFAYIRPGSNIGANVKVGDFVEVKNSTLGDRTKVSHLAYVGDADVGRDVNIGCGVITVNYDGKRKHRTVIGDGSFVGSNVNLIAPLSVGADAYLCAGSTITEDVPADGFAIARNRQVTKPDYVKNWRARREEDSDPAPNERKGP